MKNGCNMNNEDIHKLAEEYADNECAMSKHTGDKLKQLHEDAIVEFYDVFGFLIERFCIVDRNSVKERHKESELRSISPMRFDSVIGIAQLILIESIFGKGMFEEDEK